MSELITSKLLKELVGANMVRTAAVVGEQGGFSIIIKYGMMERFVAARSNTNTVSKRTFPSLDSANNFLRNTVHIVDYTVNNANFDPTPIKPLSVKTQARMKIVHQIAKHTEWLDKEIDASLADPRPTVSNTDAKKRLAANLERLRLEDQPAPRKATTRKKAVAA